MNFNEVFENLEKEQKENYQLVLQEMKDRVSKIDLKNFNVDKNGSVHCNFYIRNRSILNDTYDLENEFVEHLVNVYDYPSGTSVKIKSNKITIEAPTEVYFPRWIFYFSILAGMYCSMSPFIIENFQKYSQDILLKYYNLK